MTLASLVRGHHRPPASRVPDATYRLSSEGIVAPETPERPIQLGLDDIEPEVPTS